MNKAAAAAAAAVSCRRSIWVFLHGSIVMKEILWMISFSNSHLRGTLPLFCPKIDVPYELEHWIQKLMATDIRQRYQHAADALWGLREIQENGSFGIPSLVTKPVSSPNDETIKFTTRTPYKHSAASKKQYPKLIVHPRPPIPKDWRNLHSKFEEHTKSNNKR